MLIIVYNTTTNKLKTNNMKKDDWFVEVGAWIAVLFVAAALVFMII